MTIREVLRNRRGMALMFTLVTFLVVFIILTGVAIVANANLSSAQTSQEHTAAYFTAESGINTVSSDLRNLMNELLADGATVEQAEAQLVTYIATNNNRRMNWNNINGELVYTDIRLSYADDLDGSFKVYITSEGNIGPQQRVLSMELDISYIDGGHPIFSVKNAITALGSIDIGNQARVAEAVYVDGVRQPDNVFVVGGPIATYSQAKCTISIGTRGALDKAPPIGSVIIPTNNTGKTLNDYKSFVVCPLNKSDDLEDVVGMFPDNGIKAIFATGTNIPYPDLDIPAYPNVTTKLPATKINGDDFIYSNGNLIKTEDHEGGSYTMPAGQYYVPTLKFEDDEEFTIYVDGVTEIVTNKLSFLGSIQFEGSGELTIYVKGLQNAANNTSNIEFNNNVEAGWKITPEKLKIIVYKTFVGKKPLEINLNNNISFFGSMLLENANLVVKQNANWTGYLGTMGEKIIFNNNNINHDGFFYGPNAEVTLDQKCGLVGAIAVNTVEIGNNGFVHYDPTHLRKFPFMIIGEDEFGGGVVVDPGGDPAVTIEEGKIREGN